MSALFRIVYAAHANGTHHKLALDALNHIQRGDAEAWRRVILKNVEKYLEGSKAPDNKFKDFKNHVLHVGENYWGGAPEKVEEWYGLTVGALKDQNWGEAAYAAGVLSHYYTDPIMPFHTGQTEAENSIHRAAEWSINRSYNALRKLGEETAAHLDVKDRNGPNWLKEMTCDGAEYAHRYYEKLIAHYDIHRGTVAPEEGLDSISRAFIAQLLMYAAEGFGRIFDRAITDAGVSAPDVGLTLETFLATVNIPAKWIEKKLTNDADRKIVQAMYDELKATGRVDATLPEDDRLVRDAHAAEVLAPKLAKRSEKRTQRLPEVASAAASPRVSKFERALAGPGPAIGKALAMPVERVAEVPASTAPTQQQKILKTGAPIAAEQPKPRYEPEIEPVRAPLAPRTEMPNPAPEIKSGTITPIVPARPRDVEPRRSYLSEAATLEDAPSIGPKMAERFSALGINTVADFLGHDPNDMAELLDDSRIDAEMLTDWQDQAHLVIAVPGLRGTHAQLLVGAGYRTAEAIADADPVDLSADVLKFAASSDGKRLLRDGNPPDIEKIKDWVSAAREAIAA